MKASKKAYIIVIIVLSHLTGHSTISYGQQHYIGFTGGYNMGKFFNFSIDPGYSSKFQLKSGFSADSFYETKNMPALSLRVGLQYNYQEADIEISVNEGHSSSYTKLDYSFHLLKLNSNLVFQVFERNNLKLNVLFGPEFSYTINTKAKGEGWTYYSASTGEKQYWKKDERNSKDLYNFNFGVDLGLEFIVPVRNQLDFLIQNRFEILMTKVFGLHIPLFTGSIQVGLRYNLNK